METAYYSLMHFALAIWSILGGLFLLIWNKRIADRGLVFQRVLGALIFSDKFYRLFSRIVCIVGGLLLSVFGWLLLFGTIS